MASSTVVGHGLSTQARRIDDTEWEVHKYEIHRLYILEGNTTKDVRIKMEEVCFLASVQQYERRFRKWGWRKHTPSSSYDNINKVLKRKLVSADEITVTIDGASIQRNKLMKALRRRQPNLYEQLLERQQPTASSDSSTEIQLLSLSSGPAIDIRPCLKPNMSMAQVNGTPSSDVFYQILNMLSSNKRSGTPEQISLRSFASLVVTVPETYVSPLDSIFPHIADPEDPNTAISTLKDSQIAVTMYELITILSNNHVFGTLRDRDKLADFFARPELFSFLEWLATSPVPSSIAMLQGIFSLAISRDNVNLYDALARCGTDMNMVVPYQGAAVTPLQLALLSRSKICIIKQILGNVANIYACGNPECALWRKEHSCCHCHNSLFELIRYFDDSDIPLTILKYCSLPCVSCFDLRPLLIAKIDYASLQEILQRSPQLLDRQPYRSNFKGYFSDMLAALATRQFDVVELLVRHGAAVDVTVHAVDDCAYYCCPLSPLAFAILCSRLDIAYDYLNAGADVNACIWDYMNAMPEDYKELVLWGDYYVQDHSMDTLYLEDEVNFPLEILERTERFPPHRYEHQLDFLFDVNEFDVHDFDVHDFKWLLPSHLVNLPYPLQIAIQTGDTNAMKMVLDAGASICPQSGVEPLRLAMMSRSTHAVNILLHKARSTNQLNKVLNSNIGGLTILTHMVIVDDIDMVRILVENSADILYAPELGLTPLEAAIAYGDSSLCFRLLVKHLAIQCMNSSLQRLFQIQLVNALTLAARRGRFRIMSYLLEIYIATASGFSVMMVLDLINKTCLSLDDENPWNDMFITDYEISWISKRSKVKMANVEKSLQLLNEIFDIGERFKSGWIMSLFGNALLRMTFELESLPLFQFLTQKSIHIDTDVWLKIFAIGVSHYDSSDSFTGTVLDYLIKPSNLVSGLHVEYPVIAGVCERLLHATEAPSEATKHWESRLQTLLEARFSPEIAKISDKPTPLMIVCHAGNKLTHVAELLIRYGADPSRFVKGRYSLNASTPLGTACSKGALDMVATLLAAGAEIDGPANHEHETSLTISCRKGYQDVVLKLLSAGCSINKPAPPRQFARAPLQVACEEGHHDIVIILINRGADVNAAAGENCGVTALQAAAINGHFKICQILIGCGAKVSAPASLHHGRTAINGAAENGRLDIVNFLLDHYDGDEFLTKTCRRARKYAKKRGHLGVVALLNNRIATLKANLPVGFSEVSDSETDWEDLNDVPVESDSDEYYGSDTDAGDNTLDDDIDDNDETSDEDIS